MYMVRRILIPPNHDWRMLDIWLILPKCRQLAHYEVQKKADIPFAPLEPKPCLHHSSAYTQAKYWPMNLKYETDDRDQDKLVRGSLKDSCS